jgi:hypothetical protein
MWFWRQIVSLFKEWPMIVDDFMLQELTASTSPTLAESSGTESPDPDSRPIGRCYPEAREVERLIKELRSIHAALGNAVAALGECRANAQAANAANDTYVSLASVTKLGDVIEEFDEDLQALTDCPACKQPETLKATE